jgi:prepilin-type N-terminal cleavage/methylation domain-containing protein
MDILKIDSGFSIIETLVTIVIVSMLVIFVSVFLDNIYNNPKLFLKSKALLLAKNEMNRTIYSEGYRDTSYFDDKYRMNIIRQIKDQEGVYKINVLIRKTDKEILSLSRIQSK